ncbi:MAG: hypothetical protein LBS74_10220 [Oscillospiraceae bacterium]|jgi:hypothetical protein|nr:hypothetical protein [Oscillospiraceae bacterium]
MSEEVKVAEATELAVSTEPSGKKAKRKKTNLITPIIFIALSAFAWVYGLATNTFNALSILLKEEIFNRLTPAEGELGAVSQGIDWAHILKASGLTLLIGLILLLFSILGIIGICKLFTRIGRRLKLKVSK